MPKIHIREDWIDAISSPDLIPEKKLLVAILQRSILDLNCGGHQGDRRDAREWFESGCNKPYSFNWICDHLDISPEGFLNKLDSGGVLALSHQVSLFSDTLEITLRSWPIEIDAELAPCHTDVPDSPVLFGELLSELNHSCDLST